VLHLRPAEVTDEVTPCGTRLSLKVGDMLIIAGHFLVDPDHVDQLMAAAIPMMEATLLEQGCNEYSFSPHASAPGKVMLYENWDSQEALDSHFVAPHMATFQEALGTMNFKGRDILKYEISNVGPVR
jgi:quinol monooxygenase YgiN